MAARILKMLAHVDVAAQLAQIGAPTLILHSRDDDWIPAERGREIARGTPGARFHEIAGANHVVLTQELQSTAKSPRSHVPRIRLGPGEGFKLRPLPPGQLPYRPIVSTRRRSRKASVFDICGPHRPDAGGSIEFVNMAALVHKHMSKIPKCCRIIDER